MTNTTAIKTANNTFDEKIAAYAPLLLGIATLVVILGYKWKNISWASSPQTEALGIAITLLAIVAGFVFEISRKNKKIKALEKALENTKL